MSRRNLTVIQRLSRGDDYPYVVELYVAGRKHTHRFSDSPRRDAFVAGIRTLARGLCLRIDDKILMPGLSKETAR